MADGALSVTETRRLLDQLDLKPKKSYGQNFLIDGNIVRKSLELAAVAPGQAVVEVGPGLGTLTGALLEAGCRVFAVEKDLVLHQHLSTSLSARFPGQFFLLQGDALDHPLGPYVSQPGEEVKVVANLPYAISTPWLDAILKGPLPVKLVLMLQQETVERLSAVPGTKQYGAITVFLESAYRVSRGHRVARQCFYPIPEVDSYLFHLDRLEKPATFSSEKKQVIRACFGQRRKQIGSLVRTFGGSFDSGSWLAKLEAAGLSRQSRPEEIPAALWRQL